MGHFIYDRNDETPIWRVFRKEHALSLISGNGLYFPRPQKWDDPFENLLLKQTYFEAGTQTPIDASAFFDLFFGQCWTRENKETDATWRIYAPEKDGIRVRTTVKKLYSILDAAFDGTPTLMFFVCRVDYFEVNDILKRARLDMEMLKAVKDISGETALQHLTVKRPEFSHENEVRIIYRDVLGKVPNSEDHLIVPTESVNFIEDITVDPRMDSSEFKNFRNQTQSTLPGIPIKQSELYRIPNIAVPVYT